MKYEGTRPSGVDKDILVHQFVAGKNELRLLEDICQHYYKGIPNNIETMTVKRRLANIIKGFRQARI